MTSPEALVPRNPVEAVMPFAEKLIFDSKFDEFRNSRFETNTMLEANTTLGQLQMLEQDYTLKTKMAFLLPKVLVPDEEDKITRWEWHGDTLFTGELRVASTLKIGRELAERAIRSVCLVFYDAKVDYRATANHGVVPIFEKIREEDQVFVPVFAVDEIQQAA